MPLQVTVPAGAVAGTQVFEVDTQTAAGASDSVEGQLTVTSTVALPGVNVSLSPKTATAGQGTPARYTVTVTNIGNVTETYNLTAMGLPAGIQASFSPATITVPPGQTNFRDVTLTLTPAPGTAAANVPFMVAAVSTSYSGDGQRPRPRSPSWPTACSVSLSPGSGPPGTTFQMTVTNTGTVADTYSPGAGRAGGRGGNAGPDDGDAVPRRFATNRDHHRRRHFAVQGDLAAFRDRRPRRPTRPWSAAPPPPSPFPQPVGMTTQFSPASQTLVRVGPTSFVLLVNNTGNHRGCLSPRRSRPPPVRSP